MSEDRETSEPDPERNPDLAADGEDGTAADGADADGDAPTGDDDADADGDAPTGDDDAGERPVDPDEMNGGEPAGPGDPDENRVSDADAGPDGPSGEDGAAAEASPDADADAGTDADVSEPTAVTDGATVGDVDVDPSSDPPASAGTALDRTGPEEDVEMPLADHIEEMIRRLGLVFLVGGIVTLAVFPNAENLINYLWNTHIPGAATIADRRPRLYGPLELVLTKLKVAGLAGLIAGLPVLVYQSYRFMRPGLYPNERRYYLAAVPTSLVLAFVGVSFAHFVVLPAIFAYFTAYTTGTALVAFGLRETFNLILLLMGYMAIVFQIPLFIMLGIMMGLVTRRWLEDKRLLFWGAFLGISFLVSPDPTGMAPIIVTVTMITLYEGTLALLRWTGN